MQGVQKTDYTEEIKYKYLVYGNFQMNGMVLLPLHPQTSTSLSVWVRASSPDAGELFPHHSCSREAEVNHNKYQLRFIVIKQVIALLT